MSNIVQYWKIKNSTYPLKTPMAKQVANIILLVLSLFHLIQSIYGERDRGTVIPRNDSAFYFINYLSIYMYFSKNSFISLQRPKQLTDN